MVLNKEIFLSYRLKSEIKYFANAPDAQEIKVVLLYYLMEMSRSVKRLILTGI